MTPTPDLPACLCGGKAEVYFSHEKEQITCNDHSCQAATPYFITHAQAAACWTRMMTEPSSVPACSDREAFEAWASQNAVSLDLSRMRNENRYIRVATINAHNAWTAALAYARQTPDLSNAKEGA